MLLGSGDLADIAFHGTIAGVDQGDRDVGDALDRSVGVVRQAAIRRYGQRAPGTMRDHI